ncbi:Drug/Metabolite Transporter (DMT) Superfamily [Achlya hypogyna]|uniref:Drug/Metabolite Transporter (DMT) Superfamily n=1 Tax=Achlya hypogyna TaxID=1202772 RepID=A0A1V9Z264_ACHHY|nr:Drug/Metabolite Transporter (DMT) Superfamily [Achlya hypogyna]
MAPPAVMLLYCFVGVMATFTLNGFLLEKLTKTHDVGEMTLTFVSCSINALVAQGLRRLCREPTSAMPLRRYTSLALLTFVSTVASIYALRYVTFVTRILGKSCKSIPVMALGACMGRRYAMRKVASVVLLSVGVACFLYGTYEQAHPHAREEASRDLGLGCLLLVVSLLCDGATGAIEDKVIDEFDVHAFELMFYLSAFKAILALAGMIVLGEVPASVAAAAPHFGGLVLLSLTGASGQACLFVTLRTFGALTTSIIGTLRKVVSIVLSVVLFQHTLGGHQQVGLAVAFVAIGLNWLPTGSKAAAVPDEAYELKELMTDDASTVDGDLSDSDDVYCSPEQARALEVVVEWEKASSVITVA